MTSTSAGLRRVGILDGMGPAATTDFYVKLIDLTPATVDHVERCGAEIVVVPCNTVHGYLPTVEEQATLMALVRQVKAGSSRAALAEQLLTVTESLTDRGVTVAIAGCTELSALLEGPGNFSGLRIVDPAIELAQKTIARSRPR